MKIINKNLLFLFFCFVLLFLPLLKVKATTPLYIVVQIASNKNGICSSETGECCLTAGTIMKIDGSNSKTSTEEICVGDKIVSPLVNLSSGNHEVSLSLPLPCSGGSKISSDDADACWIQLSTNQSCSEGCTAAGMSTYSIYCCERDIECKMLNEFFDCSSCWLDSYQVYKGTNSCYGMNAWYHDQCVSNGNYCNYKDTSLDNHYICACKKENGVYKFTFSI